MTELSSNSAEPTAVVPVTPAPRKCGRKKGTKNSIKDLHAMALRGRWTRLHERVVSDVCKVNGVEYPTETSGTYSQEYLYIWQMVLQFIVLKMWVYKERNKCTVTELFDRVYGARTTAEMAYRIFRETNQSLTSGARKALADATPPENALKAAAQAHLAGKSGAGSA